MEQPSTLRSTTLWSSGLGATNISSVLLLLSFSRLYDIQVFISLSQSISDRRGSCVDGLSITLETEAVVAYYLAKVEHVDGEQESKHRALRHTLFDCGRREPELLKVMNCFLLERIKWSQESAGE